MHHLILLAVASGEVNIPKTEANSAAVETVLKIVFAIAGAMALFYVTYAGFRYSISGGEPQAVAKAKNQIIYGVIGLVISISAYSIVGFVMSRL